MFVNLTSHGVTLQSADGTRFTVSASGTVARIASEPGEHVIIEGCAGFDSGIAIHDPTRWGEPVGLPDPDPTGATTYIVSALFAGRVGRTSCPHCQWEKTEPDYDYCPHCGGLGKMSRIDVVYPGTGPADGCIRDSKGMVEAVTRLIRA